MFKFSKTQYVSTRVNEIVKSHVETRGENWLLALGYQECNDYAELVRTTVSQCSGFEHIRFETVARYVRQYKARLRKKQAAEKSQSGTV
jgi:hypothetical protein